MQLPLHSLLLFIKSYEDFDTRLLSGVFYNNGTVYVTLDKAHMKEAQCVIQNLPLIVSEYIGPRACHTHFTSEHMTTFNGLKWDTVKNCPVSIGLESQLNENAPVALAEEHFTDLLPGEKFDDKPTEFLDDTPDVWTGPKLKMDLQFNLQLPSTEGLIQGDTASAATMRTNNTTSSFLSTGDGSHSALTNINERLGTTTI